MADLQLKIGIDVGGTNTDAVLLDEHNRLLAAHKTATTPDVQSGIEAGLSRLLEDSGVDRSAIRAAMLGTTA
jgi:N-methylhydantoinase A/oxoprolinase/acetone carboxylase beta subunit